MPEDENNCPTCPQDGNTVVPAVHDDLMPGQIPEEHLAILQANAARPEVKARFTEVTAGTHIGPAREEEGTMASVDASELPGAMAEVALPDSAPLFTDRPMPHPPGEPVGRFEPPAQIERAALHTGLHVNAELPGIGPPQFVRNMTHPTTGIADPVTHAALSGMPLYRPSAGPLHFSSEACEDIADFDWEEDDPGPSDKELEAVKKFVEDNFRSLKVFDYIEVTLEPEGTTVYWLYNGYKKVPPACQTRHQFKRKQRPPRLRPLLERIHKITASGANSYIPGGIVESDDMPPPPPPPENGDLGGERPRPERPPGGIGGLGGGPRIPQPSLGKVKPVPDDEKDKYALPPEVSPCGEKVFATDKFSGTIVVAKVTTRRKPFRQATEPTDAELTDGFKTERNAIAKQAENYTSGLTTLEGLEAGAEALATCDDPECLLVQGLSIEGWNLDISKPGLGKTTYSDPRPVGDPESPKGYLVSATFEIEAFVSGTIWFSYWCV